MKQINIADNLYKRILADASKRKLSVSELIDIILRREYG